MILTITPNPAMDETYTLDHLEVGEANRAPAPVRMAGGKGINVARVIHSQRVPVIALAPVGGVNGELFTAELSAAGVPHVLVPVAAQTRRSFAIVEQNTGRTTVVNEQGSALSSAQWDEIKAQIIALLDQGATVLVASGSLPGGADVDFYPWCVREAQRRGIPSIIDAAGPALLAAARAGATVLKPNHHELAQATGSQSLSEGARILLAAGAQHVYASAGEGGLFHFSASSPGQWVSARLRQPLIGNPTGAGDSVVAAIAVGLDRQEDHETQILPRAAAWSASTVLMPTAGQLHESHPQLAKELVFTVHN